MVFNLVIDKTKYAQFLKEIEHNQHIKIHQELDILCMVTIETTKKLMIDLARKNKEILSVEKDGKLFAI